MADSMSFHVILACLIISTSHVVAVEVGSEPISRPLMDTRKNMTVIPNPSGIVTVAGLLTGANVYMTNTVDCIKLEIWRQPGLQDTIGSSSTTKSPYRTTTHATSPYSYWLLVEQSPECLRAKVANASSRFNLRPENFIRFQAGDVLGFSVQGTNPVPYSRNNYTCHPRRRTLALASGLYSNTLPRSSAYGFMELPECRDYSIKFSYRWKACKGITPVGIPQNITYTSTRTDDNECWILRAVPGLVGSGNPVIYLRFWELTLPNCSMGYIDVRQGSSSSSHLVRKYCKMPGDLQAELPPITTGRVYIGFRRMAAARSRVIRFSIQYSTAQMLIPRCTVLKVTLDPIFITSPNYPGQYPPHSDVCWRLNAPVNSTLRVRVELQGTADLEPPVGCRRTPSYSSCSRSNCRDFIEVRDGPSSYSPVLSKWCDQRESYLIDTSSGTSLSILFVSDDSVQGQGFRLKVFAVNAGTVRCTHSIALYASAVIQSPYYPYYYPNNRDDCWSVRADDNNRRLLVTVTDSLLEQEVLCTRDVVEVRDGPSSTAPLLRRWCGKTIPDSILTSGPYLFVRFRSNDMGRYNGFALSYKQVASDACTTYFAYSNRQYLAPDLGQEDKGYAIRCWVFRTEVGKMRIQWDSSGQSTDVTMCGNTYVEIHDGPSPSSQILGKFCADNPIPPQGVETSGNTAYIKWVSDTYTRPATFRLVYMATATRHCPLIFSNERPLFLTNPLPGMTTTRYPYYYGTTPNPNSRRPSPLRPCGSSCVYGPNQQRCWTVETTRPEGRNLVTIRFMELQGKDDKGNCKYDFVELRDGQSGDSPIIAVLCGTAGPLNFTTSGRWLFARFQSDDKIQFRGFKMEVSAIYDDKCEVLTARNYEQSLRSPYPRDYPANSVICWVIHSPSNGQPLQVRTLDITLDEKDRMQFFDGASSEDELLQTFDHTTVVGAKVTSSGKRLTIVLRTGDQTNSRGRFSLRYLWLFGGLCTYINIHDTVEYLISNNFGKGDYPSDDYSCWVLTAMNPRDTLDIKAENFTLEGGSKCPSDYLEIYDGPKEVDDKFLHRWCGTRHGGLLARSSGRSLFVVFSSNRRIQYPGFKLGVMAIPPGYSNGDSAQQSGMNDTLIILLPVLGAFVFLILVIAIVICCWSRRKPSPAPATLAAPAPVVVYSNQPPAYTAPPMENGAVGRSPPEEPKEPLPDDEEVMPTPPITPTTPTTTADTSTLL